MSRTGPLGAATVGEVDLVSLQASLNSMLADVRDAKQRLATIAALVSATVSSFAGSVPPFTFSPDQRYGVMIPIFHIEAA
jgi:hypothetical protein